MIEVDNTVIGKEIFWITYGKVEKGIIKRIVITEECISYQIEFNQIILPFSIDKVGTILFFDENEALLRTPMRYNTEK